MCIGIICRFLAENPPKTSNFGSFYNDSYPYYITPNSITHILAVCKEKGCRLCEFSARLTSGAGDCFAAASRANSEQLTVNSEKSKTLVHSNEGFGGRKWIRTTEVRDNRFTVCPRWPLGYSPDD